MKAFAILVLLFVAASAKLRQAQDLRKFRIQEYLQLHNETINSCLKEHSLDDEAVHLKYGDNQMSAEDVQCKLACTFEYEMGNTISQLKSKTTDELDKKEAKILKLDAMCMPGADSDICKYYSCIKREWSNVEE